MSTKTTSHKSPLILLKSGENLVVRTNNLMIDENPIDLSIINGLRRCLAEIPSVSFDWVDHQTVKVNSNSRWFVDSIAHRMGYIPFNEPRADLLSGEMLSGLVCYIAKSPTELDDPFVHDGKDSIVISTDNLIWMWKDAKGNKFRVDGSFITRKNFTLMSFPNCYHHADQTLHICATPTIGNSLDNPAFQVCTSSFRHLPTFELDLCDRGTTLAEPDDVEQALHAANQKIEDRRKWFIQPKRDVPQTTLPLFDQEGNVVRDLNKFKTPFRAELTICPHCDVMDPALVLWHSSRILLNKAVGFRNELSDRTSRKVFVTNSKAGSPVEYLVLDEDATLGELIRSHFNQVVLKRAYSIDPDTGKPMFQKGEIREILESTMSHAYNQSPTKREITIKLLTHKEIGGVRDVLPAAIEEIIQKLHRIIAQIEQHAEDNDVDVFATTPEKEYAAIWNDRLHVLSSDHKVAEPMLYQSKPKCLTTLAEPTSVSIDITVSSKKRTGKTTKPTKKASLSSAGVGSGAAAALSESS